MKESLNFGAVTLKNGTIDAGLYDYPHKAFAGAFCDEHDYALTGDEVLYAIPLMVSGRTYRERQENLRDLAIDMQEAISEVACLSMGELQDIADFFERNGRRYGLLEEFRENAVC